MKRYRVGIIGLGRMGSTIDDEGHSDQPYSIASSCLASERLEVVTAADLRSERREAFKQRWGVDALYEDYRKMVLEECPDLVAVCTTASGLQKPASEAPDIDFRGDSHAELTVALAELKVPMIYMEKAMASSAHMADVARDACVNHGTLFNTGVLRRFDVRYEVVRQAIADGVIGAPVAAIFCGKTTLMHGHVHSIDTLSFLLGDPGIEAIRGELLPRGAKGAPFKIEGNQISSDPDATFQLRFSGGIEAWSVPAGNWEFEVWGTDGVIRSESNGAGTTLRTIPNLKGSQRRSDQIVPMPFELPVPRSPVVTCLEDLVDAFELSRPTRGPVDLSAQIVHACIAIAESHRRGGDWVELPLSENDLYIFHV